MKIWDTYRPRPLHSRGVLFRADSKDEKSAVRASDDSLGWENLFTRGLEIIPIIGDHLSMVREYNPTLSREMNEVLLRHWPNEDSKVGMDAHEP